MLSAKPCHQMAVCFFCLADVFPDWSRSRWRNHKPAEPAQQGLRRIHLKLDRLILAILARENHAARFKLRQCLALRLRNPQVGALNRVLIQMRIDGGEQAVQVESAAAEICTFPLCP